MAKDRQPDEPHDFDECLSQSHAAEDLPFWGEVYHEMWPDLVAMPSHRKDGEHQRQGIDRSVVLANSERILIDEKVRGRNKRTGMVYEDILLEHYSNLEARIRGWVCKPLRAQFIAYAIAPLGLCYLLNVMILQRAWYQNGREWIDVYGRKRCQSRKNGYIWTTVSVPVPAPVLFDAMGRATKILFSPFDLQESCAVGGQ